ncbi:hypothetical protein BOTBODRAFT_109247 [Botryobasidium botryosum FD-172 SS1]|uniref:BBC1/AIM3 cysteine proteinase-fold domain-containing protein n=1 Tax=Botryobasidium botryosum (strain FD-172 SS1) TaxID=930990 RepID=A0A067MT90_BOTB1|nr:hypothetical protein BOTBODRAFT_109247 [Botryobasidium botryosum FD-172 SS1]
MAIWGKIGTEVIQSAITLVDQLKHRPPTAYPSSGAFVANVLSRVPSALPPQTQTHGGTTYGHLVFAQTGGMHAIMKISDIMPGDVVALHEARFKGRTGSLGLHSYTLEVGSAGDPLVAIVHEFEPKKGKIKVFQAATDGWFRQTVESTMYKLDDLKSGTVKVGLDFRLCVYSFLLTGHF